MSYVSVALLEGTWSTRTARATAATTSRPRMVAAISSPLCIHLDRISRTTSWPPTLQAAVQPMANALMMRFDDLRRRDER